MLCSGCRVNKGPYKGKIIRSQDLVLRGFLWKDCVETTSTKTNIDVNTTDVETGEPAEE